MENKFIFLGVVFLLILSFSVSALSPYVFLDVPDTQTSYNITNNITYNESLWQQINNNIFYDNGNVSVGTSDSHNIFTINNPNSWNSKARIEFGEPEDSASNPSMTFKRPTGSGDNYYNWRIKTGDVSNNPYDLLFQRSYNTVEGSEVFETAFTLGGNTGNVGIGTDDPSSLLHVRDGSFRLEQENSYASFQGISYSNTGWQGSRISYDRYRGTRSSPLPVQAGDTIGWFDYFSYNGTDSNRVAQFNVIADTGFGGSDRSGRMELRTTNATGNTNANLIIKGTGDLLMNPNGGNTMFFDGDYPDNSPSSLPEPDRVLQIGDNAESVEIRMAGPNANGVSSKISFDNSAGGDGMMLAFSSQSDATYGPDGLYFYAENNDGVVMKLNRDSGTVGVGTFVPNTETKLDVEYAGIGGSGVTEIGKHLTLSGSQPSILFDDTSATYGNDIFLHANEGSFTIGHSDEYAGTDADVFTVKKGGYVGINKANPTEELDVNGDIDALTDITSNYGRIMARELNDFDTIYTMQENGWIREDTSMIIQNPIAGSLWHDLFAFGKSYNIKQEYYNNYTDTWIEEDVEMKLFSHIEDQNIQVTDLANNKTAVRWTFDDVSYASGDWVVIGNAWSPVRPEKNIHVEVSNDNITWTTLHNSTHDQYATPVWHYLQYYGGEDYMRITITQTSGGEIKLASLRLLSARWGDQGNGKELEYPYYWNEKMHIGIGDSRPDYPLDVDLKQDSNNISIYAIGSISAEDFIDRSEVNTDKNVLETFVDGKELLNEDGTINHQGIGQCYREWETVDKTRPVTIYEKGENNSVIEKIIYPYTKIEEGFSTSCEKATTRQALAMINKAMNIEKINDKTMIDADIISAEKIYTESKTIKPNYDYASDFKNNDISKKSTHYAVEKNVHGKDRLDMEERIVYLEGAMQQMITESCVHYKKYSWC